MSPHIDPYEAGESPSGDVLRDLGFGVSEPIGSTECEVVEAVAERMGGEVVETEHYWSIYPRDCATCGGVGAARRIRELEAARDGQAERIRRFRERSVAITIGQETLFGTREAVENVRATIEHLKAKARTTVPTVVEAIDSGEAA